MNELQQVLNDIKQDKNTNLLPGNLRDNVTCLGVEGTAEVPTPIYATTDYRVLTVPKPEGVTANITSVFYLGDYYLINFFYNSYSHYYLYKKENNNLVLLTKVYEVYDNDYPGGIVGYNTTYVYMVMMNNSGDSDLYQFNLITNEIKSIYTYSSKITGGIVWSNNAYFNTSNNRTFKFDINNPNNGFTKINQNNPIFSTERNINNIIPIFSNVFDSLIKLIIQNDVATYIESDRLEDTLLGVNYLGNKVFLVDGIYNLSDNLAVGEKLANYNDEIVSNLSKYNLICLNEKYYFQYNGGDTEDANLYEFNEDTNTLSLVETIPNIPWAIWHDDKNQISLYTTSSVYDFTTGDTLIGYRINGQNIYLNQSRNITTDKILNGYTSYTQDGSPISGTMPNNGELNITPTTENQNIPEGYTSGGTVLGDENLKSENIKKDVSIFGVTGSLESSSGQIKLFETQEEMQSDSAAKEEDLAVVYRNEVQNMSANTQTQYITFPETVTLPEAFTNSFRGMLRPVDTSSMFDGQIQLRRTRFRFDGYSESGRISVQYNSSDGITYNRTIFEGDSGDLTNPVDLGTIVKYESIEYWDDALGYFMLIGGNTFEGLYEYALNVPMNSFKLREQSSVNYNLTYAQNNPGLDKIYTGEEVFTGEDVGNKIREILKNGIKGAMFLSKDMSILYLVPTFFQNLYVYNNRLEPLVFNSADKAADIEYYKYTLSDMQYEKITMTKSELGIVDEGVVANLPDDSYYMLGIVNSTGTHIRWKVSNSSYYQLYIVGTGTEIEYNDRYVIADTQFNAQVCDLLPGKIAYGKNGVVTGDGSIYSNLDKNEIYKNIYGLKTVFSNNSKTIYSLDDDLHISTCNNDTKIHKFKIDNTSTTDSIGLHNAVLGYNGLLKNVPEKYITNYQLVGNYNDINNSKSYIIYKSKNTPITIDLLSFDTYESEPVITNLPFELPWDDVITKFEWNDSYLIYNVYTNAYTPDTWYFGKVDLANLTVQKITTFAQPSPYTDTMIIDFTLFENLVVLLCKTNNKANLENKYDLTVFNCRTNALHTLLSDLTTKYTQGFSEYRRYHIFNFENHTYITFMVEWNSKHHTIYKMYRLENDQVTTVVDDSGTYNWNEPTAYSNRDCSSFCIEDDNKVVDIKNGYIAYKTIANPGVKDTKLNDTSLSSYTWISNREYFLTENNKKIMYQVDEEPNITITEDNITFNTTKKLAIPLYFSSIAQNAAEDTTISFNSFKYKYTDKLVATNTSYLQIDTYTFIPGIFTDGNIYDYVVLNTVVSDTDTANKANCIILAKTLSSNYTGTISPTEYNTALETSKQILGVKEEVQ